MKFILRQIIIFFIICANVFFAQSDLKIVSIGDFNTTNGKIIKDCKIGYRTIGKINSDSSNIILWPTWFTGTSEHLAKSIPGWIDTESYFIITVDALSDGISSSPSNTPGFPEITLQDIVNSQYDLLINHLNIKHLYAVVGVSMGGMQVFEWLRTYPEFMDKAIPIIGTPKFSTADLYVWQTQADLISNGIKNNVDMNEIMKTVYDMFYLACYTPSYFNDNLKPDSLKTWKENSYKKIIDSRDYLSQLNAMLEYDFYRGHSSDFEKIRNFLKADLLVVVSEQDMAVNPDNSLNFAEMMKCDLIELTGNCGHIAVWCEADKVKKAVTEFLRKKL